MQNPPLAPCYTAQLFRPLLDELLKTLRSLDRDDWQRPTLAPAWRVFYNAPYDRSRVTISGDAALALPLLGARSVIV